MARTNRHPQQWSRIFWRPPRNAIIFRKSICGEKRKLFWRRPRDLSNIVKRGNYMSFWSRSFDSKLRFGCARVGNNWQIWASFQWRQVCWLSLFEVLTSFEVIFGSDLNYKGEARTRLPYDVGRQPLRCLRDCQPIQHGGNDRKKHFHHHWWNLPLPLHQHPAVQLHLQNRNWRE